MERFILKKLNDEVKEKCKVKISNSYAALENLDDDNEDVYINRIGRVLR
jgi:hypothetical protein